MFSKDYSGGYSQPVYDPGGELLDAHLIELDPVADGFSGVVVELYAVREGGHIRYEVRQIAALSANRLLVFSTQDERLARAVYGGDVDVQALVACASEAIG